MSVFILVLGLWTAIEGGVALVCPGLTRWFGRRFFGSAGQWVADLGNATIRKIAALEFAFGIWMLVLWYTTR